MRYCSYPMPTRTVSGQTPKLTRSQNISLVHINAGLSVSNGATEAEGGQALPGRFLGASKGKRQGVVLSKPLVESITSFLTSMYYYPH